MEKQPVFSRQLQELIEQKNALENRHRNELNALKNGVSKSAHSMTERLSQMLEKQVSESDAVKERAVVVREEMIRVSGLLLDEIERCSNKIKIMERQLQDIRSICKHENDWSDNCMICSDDLYDPLG